MKKEVETGNVIDVRHINKRIEDDIQSPKLSLISTMMTTKIYCCYRLQIKKEEDALNIVFFSFMLL
jgi:hypothetical protein